MKHKDNLKVAVDARPLVSGDAVRGIGVYTRELLNAFKAEHKDVAVLNYGFDNKDLAKFDLVHFTSFNPYIISVPFTKPKNTKFVLTIYDLIPLIYPGHYPPGLRGWLNFRINKYLIKKNVDAIITISETSKKDICRFLEVDSNKVFVTYLAPPPIFKKKKIKGEKLKINEVGISKRFALYVGDINYNKNIPNLVKACKIANIQLVIAGKQAYEIEKMNLDHLELKHLKNIDWSGVIRLGFVTDETLVGLYNLATVFVQPSLYEGFGLPVLQAVTCGTPVAVAWSQCVVEVLGDDFSYCDPNDPSSIAKAIETPNINRKLPRDYSWKKTAEKTREIYGNV